MADHPPSSQQRLGEIVACHRLARDTLALLGWSAEEFPAQGIAVLKKRQPMKGRFATASWMEGADGAEAGRRRRWFLLVIHAADVGTSEAGDGFELTGAGAKASTIAYVPAAILDAAAFAGELQGRLGPRTGDALRFLTDMCPAMSGAASEPVRALMAAVTQTAERGAVAHPRAAVPVHGRWPAAPASEFTGQDTVSSLQQPVRLAVDLTARVPGAGWYVTGWLLDPLKLVSAVALRGAGGLRERLDAAWTRLAREDVSDSFRGDPLFAGHLFDDMHGFTAFVPGSTDESAAWIELNLAAGGTACMPAIVTTVDGLEDRKRLLCSVDLHKSAASDIIERHLAPLFHAAEGAAKARKDHRRARASARRARTALIVPVVDAEARTNIVVAHLASCVVPGDVKPVFVCSPTATQAIRRLATDLDFYGVDADVMIAAEPVGHCEALEIGVEATDCPVIVFLSPRVHALSRDWLVTLLAALGDGTMPCAVTPTLLYEDGSVRYAGIDAVQFSESAPYGTVVCSRAGYPRGALPRGEGASTLACAVECCAMTRSAFDAASGFSAAYALDGFKGPDLFLRMGAAGVRLAWAGGVELYALGDPHDNGQHWAVVGAMVDGWSFRAGWQKRLSPAIERAADRSEADKPVVALQPAPRARPRAAAAG